MANQLAIRWSASRLSCVEGDVVQGRVRIRRVFDMQRPQDMDWRADAEVAGQWLRQELGRHGVASRQVVIVLPRSDVVLRQLSLPLLPDEELPELVALQAETQLSAPLSDLVVDFLPQPPVVPEETRPVLLATARRSRLDEIGGVIDAGGLNLAAVYMEPVATAELIARCEERVGLDAAGTVMIVEPRDEQLNVSVVRDRRLLFSHVAQVATDSDGKSSASMMGEIRRAQGAFSHTFPDCALDRAWLLAQEGVAESLPDELSAQLTCDVRRCDPRHEVESRRPVTTEVTGLASGLGALLLADGGRMESVDFLRPRKRAVRADRGAWGRRLAIAGLAIAVLGGYAWTRWQVGRVGVQIEQTQQDVERTRQAAGRGRDAVRAAGMLAEWESQRIDSLEQLKELFSLLPGPDRLYLVDYRVNARTGEHAAQIQASGFARTREEVQELYHALARRRYVVRPQEISATSEDSEYPFQFQVDVFVPQAASG